MQNQGNEGVEKKKRIVFSKEDHLRVTRIYVEVENQFGNISENRKATHVSLLYKQQYSQNISESTIKKHQRVEKSDDICFQLSRP